LDEIKHILGKGDTNVDYGGGDSELVGRGVGIVRRVLTAKQEEVVCNRRQRSIDFAIGCQ
jgi:hypothetical protein